MGSVNLHSGGLQTMTDKAYYYISSSFTPFSSIGKTLTVQYTLKTTRTISCSQSNLVVKAMDTYVFWFGPYTCGEVSIVAIGFTNNGLEYPFIHTIDPGYVLNTAVAYKLVVPPNGTYSVYINNAVVASGSVANDFANNGNQPSGPGLFQYSQIGQIGFNIFQDQAGSVFDDILLTTS